VQVKDSRITIKTLNFLLSRSNLSGFLGSHFKFIDISRIFELRIWDTGGMGRIGQRNNIQMYDVPKRNV
jgi:hypothetical protein